MKAHRLARENNAAVYTQMGMLPGDDWRARVRCAAQYITTPTTPLTHEQRQALIAKPFHITYIPSVKRWGGVQIINDDVWMTDAHAWKKRYEDAGFVEQMDPLILDVTENELTILSELERCQAPSYYK